MIHVSRIRSTAKGTRDVTLGPKTLVVGPNASGKTALVVGLELALTGRCSVGAAPADLMAMAAGDALEVEATLSDGRVGVFRTRGSTASAKRPEWTGEGLGMVSTDFVRDALSREPKRRREAFLRAACGTVVDVVVPDVLMPLWREFYDRARTETGTDADALAVCAESLRKAVREARAAAKADPGPRPYPVDESEIADLRRRIDAARSTADRRRSRQAVSELLAVRRQAITGLEARIAEAHEGIAFVPDGILALARARADGTKAACEVLLATSVIRLHTGRPVQPCLACGQMIPDLDEAIQEADQRRVHVEKALDSLTLARSHLYEVEALEVRLADLRTEAANLEQVASDKVGGAGEDLAALETRLAAALFAGSRVAAWNEARRAAQEAAGRVDSLTALLHTCDRIVSETLAQSLGQFCDRASAVMPGGRVGLQLWDRGRAVCRVGLDLGNGTVRPWEVLSGAERAGVLAGLACAWVDGAQASGVRLVAVDDVWLDRESLLALCTGLGKADVQAIVCAVNDYELEPEGWVKVRV